MLKPRVVIVGVLVLLLAAGIGVYWLFPPLHSSFEVGMTKREVLERFGEPLGRQTEVKGEGVFVQSNILFMNEIPEGTEYEAWVYRSLGGRTVLHFVADSDRVKYIAYWRDGEDYLPPFFPKPTDGTSREADAGNGRR